MTVLAQPQVRARTRGAVLDSAPARPRPDWVLVAVTGAILVIGTLLVWSSTSHNDQLTAGHPTEYLRKQLVNVAIGIGLGAAVVVTDRRWVRILAPLVYVGSVVG